MSSTKLHGAHRYLAVKVENNSYEDRLPLWRKLCFAVGGAPYQVTCTVIAFFLNIFLLEVAQLQPRYVSIILLSGKVWDAITDPTIGILVNKTNTRWGSMRPWILFSSPFACATYFLLFYVPWEIVENHDGKQSVDASDGMKLLYYFAMFCLFEGFLSCLHVPYTSLTMYVTTSQEDRDSITAFRMGFEAFGVLVAVVVQGVFISGDRCTGKEGDMQADGAIDSQRDNYMMGSYVVIGIYILCTLIVFFGTQEKRGLVNKMDQQQKSFWEGIKLVFSFKPYLWAALTFLFMSISVAITQGNIALYCTHTLKIGDQFSYFILVMLVVSIVAMPFWQHMIKVVGKKSTFAAGLVMLIPVLISQLYLPEGVYWLYYLIMVLSGLGVSVLLLLPWSLLPDVLDLYMLEKNARHDSLFYSFYVFFAKLAAGIALGISQIVLELGGYQTGQCQQPDEVGYALRLLVTPVPVVMLLLSLYALHKYPINEDKRREIKQRLIKLVKEDCNEEEVTESCSRRYKSLDNSLLGSGEISETNA